MTVPHFVDTNVFVYARDTSDPAKQRRAEDWVTALWSTMDGRISTQVLCEFYVNATRKLAMPTEDARADVHDLQAWGPISVTTPTVEAAWILQDTHSLSFWDALIVAAAQEAECHTLLTEDLSHGETYGDVTVVNPFRQAPGGTADSP